MKNRAVLKFFLIYFGFTITSNFVHPITPAFLQMIEAPSYIQGVAFSVMSFFTFLTAPFWGIRKHIRVSSIDSGVNTNANGQALDADGKVIEGLYCVGNVGGVALGFNAMFGLNEKIGAVIAGCLGIIIFVNKNAKTIMDKVATVLAAVILLTVATVAVISKPPVGEAVSSLAQLGNAAALLIIAGAFNGLILPVTLGVMLIAGHNKRIVGESYHHPLWMTVLGAVVTLVALYAGIKAVPGIMQLFQ